MVLRARLTPNEVRQLLAWKPSPENVWRRQAMIGQLTVEEWKMSRDSMPGNLPIDPEPVTGPVPTPTRGRIVYYVDPLIDAKPVAAIITDVHDPASGLVNLTIFAPNNDGFGRTSIRYSDGRELGTWHWPPRHG